MIIAAKTDQGLLYGSFAFLRHLQTGQSLSKTGENFEGHKKNNGYIPVTLNIVWKSPAYQNVKLRHNQN